MAMRTGTFLRSRVARRIFVLVVACALVPIAALTTLSFIQVSRQLRNQSRRQLQQTTKSQGLAIYERLVVLDSDLQVATLRIQNGDSKFASPSKLHFTSIIAMRVQSKVEASGSATLPVTPAERRHLLSGKSLIRIGSCSLSRGALCVVMVRLADVSSPASALAVGEVDTTYLWSADTLPPDVDICVVDHVQEVLFCSQPGATSVPAMRPPSSASGFFTWKSREKGYDAVYRDLFLNPSFLAETWTIVVSQDHDTTLAPLRRFRNTFLVITVLALWIVILVSLTQIRRTMGPLAELGEGTRRIAAQDFDARVQIASGDEFEDLAASFNSMSIRLGRQFHTLRAISDIDQAILSSLNRNAVVHTALSRMNNLLPSECFAIAIFESTSADSISVEVTVRELQPDSLKTFVIDALFDELRHIETDRFRAIRLEPDDPPGFLVPLKNLGMTSAFVFPILLERRLFASLICGQANAAMTSEDIGHAGQVADRLAVAFSNVQLIETMEQLHWGTLNALAR